MKKLIILFFALITCNGVYAQSCLPEGITFNTQAQIDSFQIKYPGCTEIEGDVTVSGSEISNLRGLSKLTSIRGSLNIDDNNFLRDLTGLNSLKAIGGTFQIGIRSNFAFTYQSAMVNLNGLDNLTSVGGDLTIRGGNSIFGGCIYSALTSLAGLEKLTAIGGSLYLSCLKIHDFSGLGNLKSIGGHFGVHYTDINNFRGMENLSAIGGNFHLGFEWMSSPDGFVGGMGNNQYLTSFAGLNNLTFIGGSIEILGQQSLTSFTGLENLDSIGGSLIINQNSAITSLSGLENLNAGSITGLTIINNPSLSTCDVQSVCNYLANPTGSVIINGNATGCNTPPEVAGNCGIKLHCLPYGIYNFQTQSDIDSFQVNYSNCTELEGNVTIGGSDISNLNGLSGLTSIGGSLQISSNSDLTSLKGLDKLDSVGGKLTISYNNNMASLTGLERLSDIGGLEIYSNNALSSLSGLDNLISIRGDLSIGIAKYFYMIGLLYLGNPSLTSLIGLDKLASIGGTLEIYSNDTLNSLSGLENLDAGSITGLTIINNPSLSTCEVQSVCNYLANPTGSVIIKGNATGCNTPPEVAGNCGIKLHCLPYGIYNFQTQSDIDSFKINYSNCTELEGNVTIGGSDISNLNGLSALTSIGGSLQISSNSDLTSLKGLDKLDSVGGDVNIWIPLLSSLTGLERLTSIGGSLYIGYNGNLSSLKGLKNLTSIGGGLYINDNNALNSLTGLENLTHTGDLTISGNNFLTSLTGLDNLKTTGYLEILGNALTSLAALKNLNSIGGHLLIASTDSLTSLSGLENLTSVSGNIEIVNNLALNNITALSNIKAGSIIEYLRIGYNHSLSNCAVKSICDYLASPTGAIEIYNNAPGCNNPEEVRAACLGVGLESISSVNTYTIYPNPAINKISIATNSNLQGETTICIFNMNGVLLQQEKFQSQNLIELDVSALTKGIYLVKIQTKKGIETKKLVVQ